MAPRRNEPAPAGEAASPGRGARPKRDEVRAIQNRLKARETPLPRFCWHCGKPLHARSLRCPFCGESQ